MRVAKPLRYWGDEKYSGEGVSGNWPGCHGRPPLVIPASSFRLYVHTDESESMWGFEAVCEAPVSDKRAKQLMEDAKQLMEDAPKVSLQACKLALARSDNDMVAVWEG